VGIGRGWPSVVQADDWWTDDGPAASAALPAADAVSQASVYGCAKTLAVDVGSRPADPDALHRAAAFARDDLAGLGCRVAVQLPPGRRHLGQARPREAHRLDPYRRATARRV